MQNIRIHRLAALLFLAIAPYGAPLYAQTYTLVWSDEFDSTAVDRSKWVFETGAGGWGNNELEYYTSRANNVYVDSGRLVIKALKENYLGSLYTSTRMKTQGKASWKYGKIEARMKLPFGQGMWPAFWMLGIDTGFPSWPGCGEIDVMENLGREPGIAHGTIHGPGYSGGAGPTGQYTLPGGAKFSDAYHVFAIEWAPNVIRWYVDGILYSTKTPANIGAGNTWVFSHQFFIILNLAVGGGWPGNPDGTTVFPQTMMVDYVRVYQDLGISSSEVTMTSPANNHTYPAHSDLLLAADARAVTGTITKVEFFQEAMKIGEAVSPPYAMTLSNVFTGYYHFTAKATNSQGGVATSAAVAVVIDGTAVTAPYGATAAAVPGTIEMENYDFGEAGQAFSDADAGNTGNVYRSDDVDIEACSDAGGGYDVAWTSNNEWLLYTIDVKQTGLYQVSTRTASSGGGGKYHIEIDGADVTGIISAPITLGWQVWKSSVSPAVMLTKGVHALKFYVNASGFNINKMDILSAPTSVENAPDVPNTFALSQNYPNPFNPSTTIRFSLPSTEVVKLTVFDVMGTEVGSLIDAKKEAGSYAVAWNASALPSGVYFYRITAGTFSETRRLILEK